MNQEKIGKFIAKCRKEKNITQEKLAEDLGVNSKSVSRWENGKNMPDYSILKNLCTILDIDVNELLSGERITKDEIRTHSNENLNLILRDYYKLKKQRNMFIIFPATLLFILFNLLVIGGAFWLYTQQYNMKGISHFLLISIDEKQEREYIGKLDNHKIYVEGLNIKEANYITFSDERISLKEAISKKKVSVGEWELYAFNIKYKGDDEILQYENYEIVCKYNDYCIIRPLTKCDC